MGSRRTEIERHLSEGEIDEMLREAGDARHLRRIGFVKNLYQGDTIPAAAAREGRSPATGSRWAEDWNAGGLEELMPDFGGGRPPKLDEQQQKQLVETVSRNQPYTSAEIQQLLRDEFDVEYHPNYLGTFLRGLGLSYAKTRPKRPGRSERAGEVLEECDGDALDCGDQPPNEREQKADEGWVVDDDIYTD